MREWSEFEVYKERSRALLREAAASRLAREARKGAADKRGKGSFQGDEARGVRVRWGGIEDEAGISGLLALNGMPRWIAFEERFIVAEEGGGVVAALRYRTESKRLILGLLVVDPWAGERRLARALYTGARTLGRELGVVEILASSGPHADYPREAGYRRRGRFLRLDVTRPVENGSSGAHEAHPLLMTLTGAFLRRVGWR